MGREDIDVLLDEKPSISFIARTLGISRPTVYRQIRFYRNNELSKMNPALLGYFDQLIMGKLPTEGMRIDYLEEQRAISEADAETKRQEINELKQRKREMIGKINTDTDLTNQEKAKLRQEIDDLDSKIESQSRRLHIDHRNIHMDRIEWNPGAIRSASYSPFGFARVFIDADYDRCRSITVEIMVRISDEFFPCARYTPEENKRYVDAGEILQGVDYMYRLLWEEKGIQKTEGPFPIVYEEI